MSGLPGPVQASWPEGRWAQAARSLLPLAGLGGCRAAGLCVHWCFVPSSRGRDLPAPLVAWISQALVCLCSRDSIRRSSLTGCRLRSCRSGAGAALAHQARGHHPWGWSKNLVTVAAFPAQEHLPVSSCPSSPGSAPAGRRLLSQGTVQKCSQQYLLSPPVESGQ